jgi:hypothetical protein
MIQVGNYFLTGLQRHHKPESLTRNIPKLKKKVQYVQQFLHKDRLTELIKKHCCFL